MSKKTAFIKISAIPVDKVEEVSRVLEEKFECKNQEKRGNFLLFHKATMQYDSFFGKGVLLYKPAGKSPFKVEKYLLDFINWTLFRS